MRRVGEQDPLARAGAEAITDASGRSRWPAVNILDPDVIILGGGDERR